jgi:hypothetical protein
MSLGTFWRSRPLSEVLSVPPRKEEMALFLEYSTQAALRSEQSGMSAESQNYEASKDNHC